jgi:hypothetical protein
VRQGCLALAVALAVMVMGPDAAGQNPMAGTPIGGCPTATIAEFHKCALEKAKTFTPPRTSTGKPNLQGYWRSRLITAFSLEGVSEDDPNTKLAVMPWDIAPTVIVDPPDGKIPYQAWAVPIGRRGINFDKYIDPRTACNTAGVPRLALQDPSQIVQPANDTHIAWLHDDHHVNRIITMASRPHVGSNIKLWNGDSRGRWDGNTLVIETRNLNGFTWLDDSGNFFSDNVRMVERVTMFAPDAMHYEVTIEDPTVYTRPWKIVWAQIRVTEKGFELFEESCWEGERDLPRFRELGYRDYYGEPWKNRPR